MDKDQKFIATVVAIVCAVGLGLVLMIPKIEQWPSPKPPEPEPPTPIVVELTRIEVSTQRYTAEEAAGYAIAFADAATEVRAGRIKHARELLEYMQSHNKSAREKAFAPFNEQWAVDIPDEELTPDIGDRIDDYARAWQRISDQLKQ